MSLFLNESGGAHQKLLKLRNEKIDKTFDEVDKLRNLKNKLKASNNPQDQKMIEKLNNSRHKLLNKVDELDRLPGGHSVDNITNKINYSKSGPDFSRADIRDLKSKMGIGKRNIPKDRTPGVYKALADAKKHESFDLAVDYLQGCLEGTYEIDEELLEACVNIVNENSSDVTVDDYNAVMESVEYLMEANAEKISKKLDKLNAKHNANLEKLKVKYNRSYGKFADSANNDAPENKQKRLLKKADNIERKTDKAIDKYNAKKAKLEEQLKNAKKAEDKPTGRHIDLEKEKKEIKDLIQSYRNADESWRETAKKDKEYSRRIKELEEKLSKG